jgi:hypothetical protein
VKIYQNAMKKGKNLPEMTGKQKTNKVKVFYTDGNQSVMIGQRQYNEQSDLFMRAQDNTDGNETQKSVLSNVEKSP